jgi:glycerate dehydrogenase
MSQFRPRAKCGTRGRGVLDIVRMKSTVAVRARACVVNAARLNFDKKINFDGLTRVLGGASALTTYDDASPSTEDIALRAEAHEVLITKEVPIDVDALPSCVKLVCEAGTGYNNIDIAAAHRRGITVCNVPTYSSEAVAQLVLAFIHAFSVSLVEQQKALGRGDHGAFSRDFSGLAAFEMEELSGKTVGLVGGTGEIGRRVALLTKALGMRVLVWSRSAKDEEGLWEAVSLEMLMETSDFISVHCPLNDATRGLIDASLISKMKPTARIINTARGAVINEPDLVAALMARKIAGAALDVQYPEPPEDNSPLYTLDNVYLTPHIGWKRVQTRQRLIDSVSENIRHFLEGTPVNVVKP